MAKLTAVNSSSSHGKSNYIDTMIERKAWRLTKSISSNEVWRSAGTIKLGNIRAMESTNNTFSISTFEH